MASSYVRPSDLNREALEPLVLEGLSIATIAERLGASPQSVRRRIDRLGLPQPIEVRRRIVEEALRTGVRSVTRECNRHGVTEFAIVGSEQRLRCKRCRSEAVAKRRKKVAQRGITRAIAEVRREAQKCVLLCANCHVEVERGLTRLPDAIGAGEKISDYTIA